MVIEPVCIALPSALSCLTSVDGQQGKCNMQKLVSYYRVSTKKQGQSGLGLEAQKATVENYASQTGAKILREFTEVESGGKTDLERPKLSDALLYARRA